MAILGASIIWTRRSDEEDKGFQTLHSRRRPKAVTVDTGAEQYTLGHEQDFLSPVQRLYKPSVFDPVLASRPPCLPQPKPKCQYKWLRRSVG